MGKQHAGIGPHDARRPPLCLRKELLPEVRMRDKAHGLNLPEEALSSKKRPAELLALPLDQIVQTECSWGFQQLCRRGPPSQPLRDCAAGAGLQPGQTRPCLPRAVPRSR